MTATSASDVGELVVMVVAIGVLIRLAIFLDNNGAFRAMTVNRKPIGPLLLACTEHRAATPGLHEAMTQLAAAASARGVEEDINLLGDDDDDMRISRGELAAVYHAEPTARMSAPAELGVLIDVGRNRVTEAAREAWQSRLQSAGIADVTVRIVTVPDALCVSAKHAGAAAELIGQWRAYRKLLRHWKKSEGRGQPNVVVETISTRRGRKLVAIPINCTKPVYSSN